jgi:hypothetical protein
MRLLTRWRLNQRYAQRTAIAEKVAHKTHCSKRRALGTIPYIQSIAKKHATDISHYFDLNKEEMAWLVK